MNATGVTAGPAESNGRLLLSKWRDSLHVTCGLTAGTPGSAPGPTLGNEYGKTLPLPLRWVPHQLKQRAGDRGITAENMEKSQHTDFNENTTDEGASVACSDIRP